ncbi:TPA: hypothetical protein RMM48_004014 [Escherichia coli]|jgi:hypothetical protein|uniref:hypothetical protein n=1 Tax=Escherichia TaxID=561 RepID=UPI0002C935E0|nr:hypothetical protein [Escherichia coli]EFO0323826.1 hypothetical protein [Escherichia albertii]DAL42699.1 MAG TPA_asm: hypothetical protein [Caudoviricetes sp.]APK11833.1 hypothetical protein RG36_16840 [Escherichia coli]EEQ1710375.1 hypothetical protein [Escherichia coli]EET4540784.1 hypothetical protein [Escherichia coli]
MTGVVNYDVVIRSGDQPVDMDYALETLGGASEVTCLLAEAILQKKVVKRRSPANKARAVLHQSFPSSYGQNFALAIDDPILKARLVEITNPVLAEIMGFYISEAMYIQPPALSARARHYIEELEYLEDEIISRIRNPLIRMHKINYRRNWDIDFNFKPDGRQRKIVTLNTRTAANLTHTTVERERFNIIAMVTRFNSRTGNGRLVLQDEDETVAFGFANQLGMVPSAQKRMISLNLHNNNGRSDNYIYLSMTVSRVVIMSGETVKYAVHSVRVLE